MLYIKFIQFKKRELIDTENRLVVARGRMGVRGMGELFVFLALSKLNKFF